METHESPLTEGCITSNGGAYLWGVCHDASVAQNIPPHCF